MTASGAGCMSVSSMAPSYKTWQNPPVAKKTMIAGFTPRPAHGRRPHLVAVVAFDGVVLGDLSAACEVFGLAKRKDGRGGRGGPGRSGWGSGGGGEVAL